MVGWHPQLSGHEQGPGDGEGQGSLACCSPRGCKELDMTEQLDNNTVQPKILSGLDMRIKKTPQTGLKERVAFMFLKNSLALTFANHAKSQCRYITLQLYFSFLNQIPLFGI